MSGSKIRVLVAEEVRYFLQFVEVPADVQIEWLPTSAAVPEGDYKGLLPLLSRRVDESVLERLPQLMVVANFAVGFDNIDLDATRARGVPVSNTPDVLTGATADLTWSLILAVSRRIVEAERLAREGKWTWHPTLLLGMQLSGRRLGLLGAGRIGQAVGRRAIPFGMEVVYWDRIEQPEFEAEIGARRIESLDEVLASADLVSIHVQLSEETAGLIGRDQIARMKDGAILINTARGGIVDEDALCEALESGKLRGAGLDVYEGEPQIRECLKRLSNVVLLPHVGSATEDTRRKMFELAWENLMLGVRREPLLTPV
ncbi:MAG: D-glycerate dehydrogenase [Gemmatimonadota bacterium]|nr:MAG: D-glycerate dehydrogenase [Gemmatimonadota bacterium]